jgi:putative OmpL-like beta-barrel porin-2
MTRMKKMTGIVMLSLVGGLLTLTAMAQDSTRTFVVSGSADGYYRYNFNDPNGGKTNNFTSFTNSQNSFELGEATLRADGTADGGKISATADLGFGRRAEEFSYLDGTGWAPGTGGGDKFTTLSSVKQLFINYTPGKYITFTLGKWGTHIGYEVLDAYANRNYSMDYLFSYGPFSHTGFKAQYTKGNLGIMLGVANPTDNVTTTSTVKTLIAQVSDSLGPIKAYLNYQGFFGANQGTLPGAAPNFTYNGLKSLNQIDVVLTTSISSKLGLGDNFSYQSRTPLAGSALSWWGDALYINWDPSTPIGFTLRGEYISDSKSSLFPSTSLEDITLSLNYRVGSNLTVIPEVRYDGAATKIFTKSDGTGTSSTVTGLVAVVYKF